MEYFFCPDTERVEEYYKLKNSYSNFTERISFSIEIIKCDNETNNYQCKSDEVIKDFVSHLMMT